jgi:hypothetical protein
MIFLLGVLPGSPGIVLMCVLAGLEGRTRSRRLARRTTVRLPRTNNGLSTAGSGFGR